MNPYRKYCKAWWKYWLTYLEPGYWWWQVKKFWYWSPVIWRQCDFDQWYFYDLLYAKFVLLEKRSKVSPLANWERQGRQYMVCKNLCRRLRDDEYLDCENYDQWKHTTPKGFKNWSSYEQYMQNQDKNLLFKIMQRHIDTWWD